MAAFPTDRFINKFSSAEVIQLLSQARVYRLAGLLMAHRLQHLFGQEDSQADTWSHEVTMELELARHITQRPMRFVTLPFIVAAIEDSRPDGTNSCTPECGRVRGPIHASGPRSDQMVFVPGLARARRSGNTLLVGLI